MNAFVGIVEQSITLLSFMMSLLIDVCLVEGYLKGKLGPLDVDKMVRPVSVFLVVLLVCKVFV